MAVMTTNLRWALLSRSAHFGSETKHTPAKQNNCFWQLARTIRSSRENALDLADKALGPGREGGREERSSYREPD